MAECFISLPSRPTPWRRIILERLTVVHYEISRLAWKLVVHRSVHKPVIEPSPMSGEYFGTSIPYMPRSPMWSLPFRFSN